MRCEEIQNRLVEFMEDELRADERAAFSAHLDGCDACAAELKSLEHTMTLLADDGYVEPDPFYWTRFEAGLRARIRERNRRFVFVPQFGNLVPRLAPVAVAAVLFCVGLGVGLQPVLNTVSTPDTSSSFAERATDERGPVISPRSKSLVESGIGREMTNYAVNMADTLRPESFDSAIEPPQMILATDESWPGDDRLAGERLIRD